MYHSGGEMFAVIYRNYVKKGMESEYQKYWEIVATYFVRDRGAIGSTLHRSEEGYWVAYSRWPDRQTREASWPKMGRETNPNLPLHILTSITGLMGCLDETVKFPEITMDLISEVN
jgi:hypothetical protein